MASTPTASTATSPPLGYASDAQAIQAHQLTYSRSPDQGRDAPARHPVVIVGAGPVGLSLAIDLAQRGQKVLLLDNDERLSTGSRAICFAKRTLEIWDRLGVGQQMCDKRVDWNVGKVYFQDDLLYRFDLLPEPGHQRPAFINLQQYYVEAFLAVRAAELPNISAATKPQARGPSIFRPSAGSGSTRHSTATTGCCCTGSPTASGASTSSSAGTPTPRRSERKGKRLAFTRAVLYPTAAADRVVATENSTL